MSKSKPAMIVRGVKWGHDLPNQLHIKKGKLVLLDGSAPTFDIPDGTEVVLLPRLDAIRFINVAQTFMRASRELGL